MSNADRIRAKFALARTKRSVEQDCPPLEQLLAWHQKALDDSRAGDMRAHVSHCERCFELWSGLVELEPEPAAASATVTERRRPWWLFSVPALALSAVAVSVWIGFLNQPPLPAYSLDIRGGLEMRGGQTAPQVTLRDDTLLRVVVAPAQTVDEHIEAAGFAQTAAGLSPLPVTMDVTDKGVASLEAVVGRDVVRVSGIERLVFVVGREGELPSTEELVLALTDQVQVTRDNWQAFAVEVAN